MKKNILLSITILLSISSVYSTERYQNSYFKNLLLSKTKRWIVSPIIRYSQFNPQLHEDACEEYQKLGKEAQSSLDIPTHEQLPIKSMEKLPDELKDNYGALTTASAIFVNEEKLKNESFTVKKAILLHEAAHVKYHDAVMTGLLGIGHPIIKMIRPISIGIGIGLSTTEIYLKNLVKAVLCACVTIPASKFAPAIYHAYKEYDFNQGFFKESRADNTALNALNCHECLSELKEIPYSFDCDEIQNIIDKQELKKQNKLCLEHQNQPMTPQFKTS